MRRKGPIRILALDLHPRCFGYVVVENSSRLLDWGVCSCRRKGRPSDVLIQRRLRSLLRLWRPSLLVIRSSQQIQPRQKLPREQILKGIVTEPKTYRVSIRLLGLANERDEKQTKYERERNLANRSQVKAQ